MVKRIWLRGALIVWSCLLALTLAIPGTLAAGITLSSGSCFGGGGSYEYPLSGWSSSTYNLYTNPNCWRYLSVNYIDAGSPSNWYSSGYSNISWWLSDNGDRSGCSAFHMLGSDAGNTVCTI